MKRISWATLLVIVLLVAAVAVAYAAQQSRNTGSDDQPMAQGPMPGHGMGRMGMMQGCPMQGRMMGGGQRSMVAIGNHIFILAGNKLMKYDVDLKKVDETQIPVEPMGPGPAGGPMGGQPMQGCPMVQGAPR